MTTILAKVIFQCFLVSWNSFCHDGRTWKPRHVILPYLTWNTFNMGKKYHCHDEKWFRRNAKISILLTATEIPTFLCSEAGLKKMYKLRDEIGPVWNEFIWNIFIIFSFNFLINGLLFIFLVFEFRGRQNFAIVWINFQKNYCNGWFPLDLWYTLMELIRGNAMR